MVRPRPRHPIYASVCPSVLTRFVRFVLLGVVILLFFKCMAALLDPVHRRGEPIKWGLISYTVVMFSLANLQTALTLQKFSLAYIDNREFPNVEGAIPPAPGPIGYLTVAVTHEAISTTLNVAFTVTNWLADGFLVSSFFDAAFTHPGVVIWFPF